VEAAPFRFKASLLIISRGLAFAKILTDKNDKQKAGHDPFLKRGHVPLFVPDSCLWDGPGTDR